MISSQKPKSYGNYMNNNNTNSNRRIILLFDLDCFYAQCERVRLGLDPKTTSLALLQWNSVLAVTYPARELYGIKRGDTWDVVDKKSNGGDCWSIHLKLLDLNNNNINNNNNKSNDDALATADADAKDDNGDDIIVNNNNNNNSNNNNNNNDIVNAYNKIYNLSKEQQLYCRSTERGKRRYHYEGKACLERYRIASAMIFDTVLESLTTRLGTTREFVLERASIDEFYLDITKYCYNNNNNNNKITREEEEDNQHNTVVVGNSTSSSNATHQSSSSSSSWRRGVKNGNGNDDDEEEADALKRACVVSNWIRSDVYKKIGFTMSTGISTNKMMAKLAASYGKPNGQAVLSPHNFTTVMNETKIRKVRNFGGKLGKRVIQPLKKQNNNSNSNNNNEDDDDDDDTYMMGDLQQLSLPYLQQHLRGGGEETTTTAAQFVFDACRGLDQEQVKETRGALVKSITAFKSFPATKSILEIQNWVSLLSNEIIDRVSKDTTRNNRYPKSCTLKYSYYSTTSGQRPTTKTSRRSSMESRSIRLQFPNYQTIIRKQNPPTTNNNTTTQNHHPCNNDLVVQAMDHLRPILTQRPIRGVGLSASNFESRGGGSSSSSKGSIDTFFNKAKTTTTNKLLKSKSDDAANNQGITANNTTSTTTTSTAKMASTNNYVSQTRSSRKRTAPSVGGLDSLFRHSTQEAQSTMKNGAGVVEELSSQKEVIDIDVGGVPDEKMTSLVETSSTMMVSTTGNRQQQQENQDPSSRYVGNTAKNFASSTANCDCYDSEEVKQQQQRLKSSEDEGNDIDSGSHYVATAVAGSQKQQQQQQQQQQPPSPYQHYDDNNTVNSDFEMAKRLQASFDRENDILSQVPNPTLSSSSSKTKKKVRRIDTFFATKRR